jgi:hypothetical protein
MTMVILVVGKGLSGTDPTNCEIDIANIMAARHLTRAFALRRGARLGLRHPRLRRGLEILSGGR